MSPEIRIVSYLVFIVSLFLVPDIVYYTGLLSVLGLCLVTVPYRALKAGWLPIIMFLSFTFFSNLFNHSGKIIYTVGPVMIAQEGLHLAALRTLRVLLMIGGVKFLMAKTGTDQIVMALAKLFRPFEMIGLPVIDFFHVVGLTLRCFPALKAAISKHYTEKIQKGDIQNVLGRAQHMALFMLPLFVESIHSPERFFLETDLHEEEI